MDYGKLNSVQRSARRFRAPRPLIDVGQCSLEEPGAGFEPVNSAQDMIPTSHPRAYPHLTSTPLRLLGYLFVWIPLAKRVSQSRNQVKSKPSRGWSAAGTSLRKRSKKIHVSNFGELLNSENWGAKAIAIPIAFRWRPPLPTPFDVTSFI